MEALPDHYAALGISPAADQEVIAAAYRALAKKFHPDTGSSRGSASPERFAQVLDAWETLGDPERRRRYDALRRGNLPPHAREAAPPPERPPAAHRSGRPPALRGAPTAPEMASPAELPGQRPHALTGERRIADPVMERRRGAMAPIFGIALVLGAVLLGALWLMPQWLAAPQAPTASLAEPKLPAAVETSTAAAAPADSAPAQPEPAAPVPKRKPVPPPQQEAAAETEPASQGEILFALSILPQAGGPPVEAEPAQVMFSTRSRCESFGAEALERRRAAARGRNEPEPRERFACVQFSGRAQ